jgi:hypothetical protein
LPSLSLLPEFLLLLDDDDESLPPPSCESESPSLRRSSSFSQKPSLLTLDRFPSRFNWGWWGGYSAGFRLITETKSNLVTLE